MTGSMHRVVRVAVSVAALILGAAVLLLLAFDDTDDVDRAVVAVTIGGPFELVDQTGATVTEAALQGHPSALFFGYTFCPDVCPTTLFEVTTWLEELGADANKLRVYFITVDPGRDTQDQLASYLEAFDP